MNRRRLLVALAGVMLSHSVSRAQQTVFRVGWLAPGPLNPYVETFFRALQSLGYKEGQNLIRELQLGEPQDLPAMAHELVRIKCDVIYAGASSGVRAAMAATRTVPVVGVDLETDPVASGYATSLARPGGNLTGLFLDLPEFSGKRLELLKEALPAVTRVMVLWDSSLDRVALSRMATAAQALKLKLFIAEIKTGFDLEASFGAALKQKPEAVLVMQSPTLDARKDQILNLGAKAHLPVLAVFGNFTNLGALLSYGPNAHDLVARAASYVDKILKGTRPGELPIERPAKFDFVVNVKAAKVLGLKLPESVLARADEIMR